MYQDTNTFQPIDAAWWTKDDPGEAMLAVANHIWRKQDGRRGLNNKHIKMYDNTGDAGPAFDSSGHYIEEEALTKNICKSIATTALSNIFTKTRVAVLTDGGDYKQRKRGKQLEKFVDGIFRMIEMYPKAREALLDSMLCDSGYIKIYRRGGQIFADRVFPNQILVDDTDGMFGKPRSIYQRSPVPREVLSFYFKDDKKKLAKIAQAGQSNDFAMPSVGVLTDVLDVTEGWHLPSGHGAEDGRHTIAIDGVTLVDKPYKYDYFPILRLLWAMRPKGYYGASMVSEVVGAQYTINLGLEYAQEHFEKNPARLGIEMGSQINTHMINNEPWSVVEFKEKPPVPLLWPAVPPDLRSFIQETEQGAYESVGVSELRATGKKPAGLNAGVALREYEDIQSQRHKSISERLEEFYVDAAMRIFDLAKEIAEDDDVESVSVIAPVGRTMERIKWEDVDMDRDAFIMQPYPTSFLPKTPSARLQTVQEMMTAGLITRREGLRLLDYPDIQAVEDMINASINHVEMVIDRILDKGEIIRPDPFMDLEMAVKRGGQAVLLARIQNAPPENVELLQDFVTEAGRMLMGPPPEQAPQPAPGPQGPQMAPPENPMSAASAEQMMRGGPGPMPQPQAVPGGMPPEMAPPV